MEDSTRLDSATALARTPLFSHLGRLDLARLAGELEELSFKPGEAIVREGDPADGFYVINSGRVVVVAATPVGDGSRLVALGPGEAFGEIALLTDSPRTASVLAETDVTVWRLARARFEALLGHERSIAQSIERSLSLRLAATSHEAGALRAVTHALLQRMLGPDALALMGALLLRAEWPREVLARACRRTETTDVLAPSGAGSRWTGPSRRWPAPPRAGRRRGARSPPRSSRPREIRSARWTWTWRSAPSTAWSAGSRTTRSASSVPRRGPTWTGG
jgi:CRP-like cAMP-binding protein